MLMKWISIVVWTVYVISVKNSMNCLFDNSANNVGIWRLNKAYHKNAEDQGRKQFIMLEKAAFTQNSTHPFNHIAARFLYSIFFFNCV